ncbi:MAG: CDP-diacylglycerol--glycerol-3-phosphate 3-phosphatidyltransferase [Alphaproteobacteria bacterium MarineAlpha3_Bin5]|nr:CDP-alcohol phosphatidyltransferase [Magnetovibrio sp.]PPR79713.1 MAG: CDP-diacylglycerol--glycerol-3-phosphate 3-phosphatidyltransferase [Alphaproteobacteria bacterium MarineAlpha3_Bin5]
MNIPNLISISRLLIMPSIVWFILSGELAVAFWIFFVAAMSDAIDGIIAKKFDLVTQLGMYLDPLADKILLVSVYFTLGHQGFLPIWLVILVIFRDVLIVGGAILFETLTRSLFMDPLWVSKLNTLLQVILAGVVLYVNGYHINYLWLCEMLHWAVGFTTVISGISYVMIWGTRAVKLEKKSNRQTGLTVKTLSEEENTEKHNRDLAA